MEENRKPHQPPAVDAEKANDESVIRVHALIRRTPVAGSPVVFFTSMTLIVVFVFGWFYFRRYFADFDSHSYLADREQRAAMHAYLNRPKEDAGPVVVDGAAVYAQQCVACHQGNGEGLAGAFPPLAGADWVTEDPETPVKILLAGLSGPIEVNGATYNGAMPAFGAVLSDAEIAAVVTHIRTTWGNEASEVTAEQVASIRESIGARGNWTAEELRQ